jgi:ATP-dependent Clp protease protease subunit
VDIKAILERSVFWNGQVNEENFNRVVSQIIALQRIGGVDNGNPICLFLRNPGGQVNMGFAFYDLMRCIHANLITIGIGEINSIAPIIFLAGKMRLVTQNTVAYFHEMGHRLDSETGYQVPSDTGFSLNASLICNKKFIEIFCREVPELPEEKIASLMKQKSICTAQELLQLGIAHGIIGEDATNESTLEEFYTEQQSS